MTMFYFSSFRRSRYVYNTSRSGEIPDEGMGSAQETEPGRAFLESSHLDHPPFFEVFFVSPEWTIISETIANTLQIPAFVLENRLLDHFGVPVGETTWTPAIDLSNSLQTFFRPLYTQFLEVIRKDLEKQQRGKSVTQTESTSVQSTVITFSVARQMAGARAIINPDQDPRADLFRKTVQTLAENIRDYGKEIDPNIVAKARERRFTSLALSRRRNGRKPSQGGVDTITDDVRRSIVAATPASLEKSPTPAASALFETVQTYFEVVARNKNWSPDQIRRAVTLAMQKLMRLPNLADYFEVTKDRTLRLKPGIYGILLPVTREINQKYSDPSQNPDT